MIEYNSRLNNFFGARVAPLETQITANFHQEKRYNINLSGKFHEINPVCSCCGSRSILHNGNDKCKSKFIKELGLTIKKGKFKCKKCSHTWTTRYKDAELFVQQYKQLVYIEVFQLCTLDISYDNVAEHIITMFGKKISREWVRQIYIKCTKTIERKKVLNCSGIFNYDEQYLEVNGKTYVRIVVIDAVTKKVIFDEKSENSRIETLKDKLNMKLLPYTKEAFIIDLARGYPKMLSELFPNIKVQLCIFHLNKLIIADFKGSKKLNKYGKKVLPLQELYNQYLLLDLFMNHEVEKQFLKKQLKKLDKRNELFKEYNFTEKTIISFYEMRLISEFNEFRKGLKKNRRKHKKKYLLKRTKDETMENLKKLEAEIGFFPKQVQKRIKKIRKDIDKFTLFQENPLVHPTNNNIEQYYAATLQKTEKKKFRSNQGLETKLKILREKWNQTLNNLKFNLVGFLQLFAKMQCYFKIT